ncbi:hypothetical protein BH20PSE1_BH20PSE1_22540 [soil metagenome]
MVAVVKVVNSNRGMSLNEDVEVWFKLPVWIDG